MSEPPLVDSSRNRSPPVVGLAESRISSSAPERTIDSYAVHQVIPSKRASAVSLPGHMKTLVGQIAQLQRITGTDFHRVDSYRINPVRIPVLKNIFSEARRGKLPSLSQLLDNRKQHVSGLGKNFGSLVGEPVHVYLHLLLFLHNRGIPGIRSLAPYHVVKQSLIEYWNFLVCPEPLGKKVQLLGKQILGDYLQPEDLRGAVQTDPEKEQDLIIAFSICIGNVEEKYWMERGSVMADYYDGTTSSLTNRNMLNLLQDFLSLAYGGRADRVMSTLPAGVVQFLDDELGNVTFISPEKSGKPSTLSAGRDSSESDRTPNEVYPVARCIV